MLAFNPEQIGEMQQFNQFAGSLAGAGLGYAVNGKMTLNVLNFGFLAGSEDTALNRILSTGLLEMRLGGEDGFSMSVGTAGTDVSFGTVATAMVGLGHWGKSLDIKEMAKRNMAQTVATETQKMLGIGDEEARQAAAENLAVAMRGAYGFGDEADLVQLDSILRGGTQVRVGEKNETVTVNGARNVTLAGLMDAVTDEQKLALAVALSHEAYRDGEKSEVNYLETRGAVLGHTEMADRMRTAGYNIADNPLIALDLAMYDYAKSVGDMSLMDLYADTLYRSDGDYMDIISSPYDVINKTFRMTIMPIGGGWTDIDEFVIKLTGGAGALMSLSGGLFAVAQTIYGFITSPINVDNIVNMAGVVMGKASEGASENAKNVLGWAGLFGSLFGVVGSMITTSKNLNITPTEYALNGKSRNDMIMLEYDFLHAVRTALGDNGFIVNEGRSTNNESLKNLNVIVLGSYTEEEVANKRWEIINIIKGVRNEKKYRGINLYYREIY